MSSSDSRHYTKEGKLVFRKRAFGREALWLFREFGQLEKLSGLDCIPKLKGKFVNSAIVQSHFDMEFIEGGDFQRQLNFRSIGRGWHYRDLLPFFVIAYRELQRIHNREVIHRDLKPDNIMWGDGSPRFVDFGISAIPFCRNYPKETDFMRSPRIAGNFYYCPPEQFRGLYLTDERSDIYSLAAVMYESFSGSHPFQEEIDRMKGFGFNPYRDLSRFFMYVDPTPLIERDFLIPQELNDIVMCCMKRDMRDRPESALVVAQQLREFAERESIYIPE